MESAGRALLERPRNPQAPCSLTSKASKIQCLGGMASAPSKHSTTGYTYQYIDGPLGDWAFAIRVMIRLFVSGAGELEMPHVSSF
jgi:hypothetical protein